MRGEGRGVVAAYANEEGVERFCEMGFVFR